MIHLLATILTAPLIFILSLAGYSLQPQISVGAYNPSGGQTYRLQSSIASTDTSITLSSFKEPISNIKYTMAYLSSTIEFGTLDPANTTNKEFISFSGITQNSDGTAQLTGVVRGLGFSFPYTASTTLQKSHSGQSIFILSNPPQLTNQYLNKNNTDSVEGIVTFQSTTSPRYNQNPNLGDTPLGFATQKHVQDVTVGQVGTATEATLGLVRIASFTDAANSVASSSSGAPLVLSPRYATSTRDQRQSSQVIPVTDTSGQLHANFIATSSVYNWGGANTWTASTTHTASTTMAATSFSASGQNPIALNGVFYRFPAGCSASSTVWSTDGTGGLTCNTIPDIYTLLQSTTTQQNMRYATTTWTGNFTDIYFILDVAGFNNASQAQLNFNTDGALASYGSKSFSDYGRDGALGSSGADRGIVLNQDSTTTRMVFWGNISNNSGTRKIVTWTGGGNDTGARAPIIFSGAGVWNNTSTVINNLVIHGSDITNDTITSGSILKIFGRP